jgi:hypothetical protein
MHTQSVNILQPLLVLGHVSNLQNTDRFYQLSFSTIQVSGVGYLLKAGFRCQCSGVSLFSRTRTSARMRTMFYSPLLLVLVVVLVLVLGCFPILSLNTDTRNLTPETYRVLTPETIDTVLFKDSIKYTTLFL